VTITIGVPLTFLAAFLSGQLFRVGELTFQQIAFVSTAGILQYVWGRFWGYSATRLIGAVGAGPINQSQMWIAVTLAVVFLGERITLLKFLGMMLIFTAPFIIAVALRQKRKENTDIQKLLAEDGKISEAESMFIPKIWLGYGCALLAALGYGVAPVLVRSGIGDAGLGLNGAMFAYLSAFFTFWLIALIVPGQLREIKTLERQAGRWYVFSGLLTFSGQACYFLALSIAPVTVVAPLFQLSMIARVVASYLINPKHEVLSMAALFAIAVSFAGTLAISIDMVMNSP
jgi:uncharacterized membrane protein